MKILQVCSAETNGGGERHVIDLTRALIERGHELHLAVRPQNSLQTELHSLPIKWHKLPLRNAADIFSARQLAHIIRAENIEIMHAHLGRDYTSCGLAAKLAPVKFFLTRHHFNPIKTNFLYRWAMNRTTNLIAVSQTVKNELASAFPHLGQRITVIPNWVDLKKIATVSKVEARAELGIKHKFAVGVIGQISPLKNQELLLAAAYELHTTEIFKQTDFVIVGSAAPVDHAYEQNLRYRTANADLTADRFFQRHIIFAGQIPDLAAQLAAFDIIVVPSINEGFSLVTIEAMAAGCAVIAHEIGALAEIITHEKNGLLITPNDVAQLVIALQLLLADEDLRTQIGEAAKNETRNRFERTQVITQIEQLYQLPKK